MINLRAFSFQNVFKSNIKPRIPQFRNISYVQGQEPESKIREYFYYIDHQGMSTDYFEHQSIKIPISFEGGGNMGYGYMLFLDDARMKNFTSCFKERKFLKFFFNQLRLNTTGRYKEFPYVSLCGKERNFVRCDDYPIVFTHVISIPINGQQENRLAYNHAGDLLSLKFQPEKIFMSPETGRVYHPAPERAGSIGLVRSKLAIEFSKYFHFDKGETRPPTSFIYDGKTYQLDLNWYYDEVKNKPNETR